MANEDHRGVRAPGNAYDFQRPRRMNGGVTLVSPTGGASLYGQSSLAHGLGVTPQAVVASAQDGECYATVQNYDAINFLCTTKRTNGVNQTTGSMVNWIAFG